MQAAEVALAGVREEAKVGQRTTLDVLNAQQTLLNARVQLVTAEHDAVVNSYAVLSAIGRLSISAISGSRPSRIRPEGSLRSGEGQVVRPAHAGWRAEPSRGGCRLVAMDRV